MVTEFHGLYAPIIGSSEPTDRSARDTPEALVARTSGLRNEYEDLQTELMQELDAMENRMIRPAAQAKELLAPMKKTIKKREDRKVDPFLSSARVYRLTANVFSWTTSAARAATTATRRNRSAQSATMRPLQRPRWT